MSAIKFPETWSTDCWYGFKRHLFTLEGCNAWVVEPDFPAPDGRWSWCAQWAESFVPNVGTVALLEHGFYHAHIDVFKYRGNPEGIRIMRKFQACLTDLGLSAKVNLIGMSWGGFLSLRYASQHPECVQAIYLDAPVCNAADDDAYAAAERHEEIKARFGMSHEQLETAPLNPINAAAVLAEAGIPIFAVIGQADRVVVPALNFDILAERLRKAGMEQIELSEAMLAKEALPNTFADVSGNRLFVFRRQFFAHHPHGMDNPLPILAFHWKARM